MLPAEYVKWMRSSRAGNTSSSISASSSSIVSEDIKIVPSRSKMASSLFLLSINTHRIPKIARKATLEIAHIDSVR